MLVKSTPARGTKAEGNSAKLVHVRSGESHEKKLRQKTILIDDVRYFADKPSDCRQCFFWKNRKAGCILGKENCYYLAETIKTEQEHRCENCSYVYPKGSISDINKYRHPGIIFSEVIKKSLTTRFRIRMFILRIYDT